MKSARKRKLSIVRGSIRIGERFFAPRAPIGVHRLSCSSPWGCSSSGEGQCLYAVRHFLKGGVPVPEIYGWRTDGGEVFLYLQLLRGQTLEQAWEAMGMEDRVRVCQELRTCLSSLRRLEQDPVDPFVGKAFSIWRISYSVITEDYWFRQHWTVTLVRQNHPRPLHGRSRTVLLRHGVPELVYVSLSTPHARSVLDPS